MPLINTTNHLYIGTAAAAAAYKNGDRVWPPDSGVSTVTATLAQTTAPTVRLTISHTGEVPVLFKLYRTTSTAWTFWKDVAVGGAYDYTTTYSTTISMKVEAYYADGSAIIAYSNPVAVGPAPPPAQVAKVFEANSVEWASFNKNGRRTDATSCYYGNVSTTREPSTPRCGGPGPPTSVRPGAASASRRCCSGGTTSTTTTGIPTTPCR